MPKIVDHDAQRRTIIEAALQLFVQHGYEGVGMRELAKQLDLSKSGLYHYFPSKSALFAAVVDYVVQTDIMGFDMAQYATATRREKLNALLDFLLANEDWYDTQLRIMTDYVRLRPDDDDGTMMHDVAQQYIKITADFLDISIAESHALYLQINGALIQRMTDNRRTDFRAALQWIVDALSE